MDSAVRRYNCIFLQHSGSHSNLKWIVVSLTRKTLWLYFGVYITHLNSGGGGKSFLNFKQVLVHLWWSGQIEWASFLSRLFTHAIPTIKKPLQQSLECSQIVGEIRNTICSNFSLRPRRDKRPIKSRDYLRCTAVSGNWLGARSVGNSKRTSWNMN